VIGSDPGVGTSDTNVCQYAPLDVYWFSAAAYDQVIDQYATLYRPDQRSDVTDMGDKAVKFTSDDGSTALFVEKGPVVAGVTAVPEDQARALVAAMLAKLPS